MTRKDDKFTEKSFPEAFLGCVRGIVALRAPHQLKYLNNCLWAKKWTIDCSTRRRYGVVAKRTSQKEDKLNELSSPEVGQKNGLVDSYVNGKNIAR